MTEPHALPHKASAYIYIYIYIDFFGEIILYHLKLYIQLHFAA